MSFLAPRYLLLPKTALSLGPRVILGGLVFWLLVPGATVILTSALVSRAYREETRVTA